MFHGCYQEKNKREAEEEGGEEEGAFLSFSAACV